MGELNKKDTFTIGGMIAEIARNSKAGRQLENAISDYLGHRVDPNSEEYREMVEGMESMTGNQTRRHGSQLSRQERKAVDEILRKAPKAPRKRR